MNNGPAIFQSPRAHILIVDSMQSVCCVLAELLARHGYTSDVAMNAGEALHLAETSRWDAVVLDVGLPGMDEIELYLRLNRGGDRENLPVIFVTGYTEQMLLQALQIVPWASHLLKPFSVPCFLGAIDGCLQSRRMAC